MRASDVMGASPDGAPEPRATDRHGVEADDSGDIRPRALHLADPLALPISRKENRSIR